MQKFNLICGMYIRNSIVSVAWHPLHLSVLNSYLFLAFDKTLDVFKIFFFLFLLVMIEYMLLLQGGQSVAGHSVPGCARAVPRRDAQPGRLLLCASRGQASQPGGRRRGHGSNLFRAGGPHLTLHRVFRQLQVRELHPCFPAPFFDSNYTPLSPLCLFPSP